MPGIYCQSLCLHFARMAVVCELKSRSQPKVCGAKPGNRGKQQTGYKNEKLFEKCKYIYILLLPEHTMASGEAHAGNL